MAPLPEGIHAPSVSSSANPLTLAQPISSSVKQRLSRKPNSTVPGRAKASNPRFDAGFHCSRVGPPSRVSRWIARQGSSWCSGAASPPRICQQLDKSPPAGCPRTEQPSEASGVAYTWHSNEATTRAGRRRPAGTKHFPYEALDYDPVGGMPRGGSNGTDRAHLRRR